MNSVADESPVRPRLSLCIATMNREAFIGETLESLAAQWPVDAELAILDGSAGDATERIVAGFRARLPGLIYERRPPAGFDRDFCAVVAMSRGEYCWLFPDDDVLRPGAMAAVRQALAGGPDAIIVNAEVRDDRLREVIDGNRLRIEGDRRFGPGEFEAFARLALSQCYVGYVGSLVIRRTVWDARAKEVYFGTDFLPVGVVLQRPFEGEVIVLAKPWIAIRYGVALWIGRAFGIWNFAWPELIWGFAALSEAVKTEAIAREPWRDWQRLLIHRAQGWLDWKVYRRWLRDRPLGFRLRCVVWLLCLIPYPVVNRLVAARWRRYGFNFGVWDLDHGLARWRAEPSRR